jgi:hypothetical protein
MVGDYHLQRGAPSVLAGPPGCGKSRAALWLAILGAWGSGSWFGYEIRSRFRSLLVQNENGLTRLHRDLQQVADDGHQDEWFRISAPPACGLAIQNRAFLAELQAVVRDFDPQLLVVDPFNGCVRDAMEKDFQEALSRLREVVAEAPGNPAWLILHHLRKPKADDRHKGRNLAHLLSGSYVLVSVARSVLVMQPASDDTEDRRAVVTCAKNNDGALGPRSAWERRDGLLFEQVQDFDFAGFDSGNSRHEPKVGEDHLHTLFERGTLWLPLKEAVTRLQQLADVGRTAAYEALKLQGRFGHLLTQDATNGMISVRAESPGDASENEGPL